MIPFLIEILKTKLNPEHKILVISPEPFLCASTHSALSLMDESYEIKYNEIDSIDNLN